MIISTEKIENMLRLVSPELIDWNPTDAKYLTVDGIEELIDMFPALPWKENVYECEEIAKSFVSDVRKHEALSGQEYNAAIGVANCSMVQGNGINHTLNIFITDKVMLLDMQTRQVWEAAKGEDVFYFVEM